MGMETDETFSQRCVRAARADVERCWEDYIELVNRRPAGSDRNAGGGASEDLRKARASLVTALAIERAALGALGGDDERDDLADDEV